MTVKLRYELHDAGWADCTVEIGPDRVTASASYLSDALDSLSGAVVSLLKGDDSAEVIFSEEPGEFRWLLTRVPPDQLRVRIYWSLPRWNDQPHDVRMPILDATCRMRTFAGQVLAELQRLFTEYGETGYKARWVLHDFPSKRLHQLEELLAGPDSSRVGA